MNIEELREYCLSLPLVTEYMPFKEEYLIFRVYDKWFAVIPMNDPDLKISVKCNPDLAMELRDRYQSITPAWHFNKKYWNSIVLNNDMNDSKVKECIRHSIDEVVGKLSKALRQEYDSLRTW
ncbi:MmcQ/YjbR family DNA-binding protein [Flavobacterium cerinum]|uniref:MmcQ/YjbR family DNA-binding protein n=1 Tax=Flavobacterium cerinum TaxID=2502784 RepID=A0ABY5IRC5_9FLAO|nr:MmcQ/YjbR family DNA-binding protein [Flavobacterium cerinum]UUC44831.1 MmcQ/YjbR family DNA-binding protein [Flavobacterium cerinum]